MQWLCGSFCQTRQAKLSEKGRRVLSLIGLGSGTAESSAFGRLNQDSVRADLAAFFGPRSAAYVAHYERRRQRALAGRRGLMTAWSWPAFGAWIAWFWYRKLWGYGLVAFLLPVLGDMLPGGVGGLAGLALVGWLAKDWYLQTALLALRQADTAALEGDERHAFLGRKGGVSPVAGGFGAILALALGAASSLRSLQELHRQLEAAGLL